MRKLLINLLLVGCFAFLLSNCKNTSNPIDNRINYFGDFSIPQDSITVDPNGDAPLCAIVDFTTPQSGKTKIIVRGKNGASSDLVHQFEDFGSTHTIPVAGLYPSYDNTVDIIISDEKGNTLGNSSLKITTGAISKDLPTSISVSQSQIDKMEPGLNLVSSLSSYSPAKPLFIDNYGDVRGVLDFTKNSELNKLAFGCGIEKLQNGNFYFGDLTSHKIYEVDITGKILNRWELHGYHFHHNVYEKPNGNFLVTVEKPGSTNKNGMFTVEDYVIEIDRNTGALLNEWDLKESLDESRSVLSLNNDQCDWIHLNSVIYDKTDNTIIVSGRVQGVVKLTYDNKVKWILGPHKGWGKNRRGEDLNQFLLTPVDAQGNKITDSLVVNGIKNHNDFEWNWYQHSLMFMPNGNIMMFDNGDSRNFNFFNTNHYSRAVEFKIDQENMTVQQVWAYGKERGLETFSAIYSRVQYLPNTNHILFCPGSMVCNCNGKGGKIVEIDYNTKQVVFEMSICTFYGTAFQRTNRYDIYP